METLVLLLVIGAAIYLFQRQSSTTRRQQLESQSRSPVGGGGQDRSQGARSDERVEIPTGRSKADELAWRRRVLDAKNGTTPPGFEQAVDDYYQRLLR